MKLSRLVLAAGVGWITGFALGGAAPVTAGSNCPLEPQMNFGPGNNTVYDTDDGIDENNFWFGQNGQDFLRSLACDDRRVDGGDQADDLGGGSLSDTVAGGLAGDHLYGGANKDFVYGDAGVDDLHDDEPSDIDSLFGDKNNDFIDVDDTDPDDVADGGTGTDDCDSDPGDDRFNCEA